MPHPDLHPDISTVKAVVTTRWKGKAYRPLTIESMESYFVDTALDNDADTWTMDFGDPNGDYIGALLDMNNEVRVQLFGVGRKLHYIMTGIADEVDFQDGTWTVAGRDLSSLATDSAVLPHRWAKARAWSIVKSQAQQLGFKDTNLSHTGIVKKVQYTDGSETYWDFWYRLYRQEKMWLWTTPTGILVGSKLNYDHHPYYYLGDSRDDDGDAIKSQIIPIIQASLHKTTQTRLEEVVVYGSRGNTNFNYTVKDPTLAHWIKKSRKIMLTSDSRTGQAARRAGWEEIYEGKVGAIELKITVPDPGFPIQANKTARLYIKDIGLYGTYFVVGTRIQGDKDGFVQEIRLRELGMALSKRVPTAPKLQQSGPPNATVTTSLGKQLEQSTGMPHGWGDYFVKAAKKNHGIADYQLFLATLIAIADTETSFHNIRQYGGPGGDHHDWYPFKPPSYYENLPGQILPNSVFETREHYEQKFANEPGVYGITTSHPWGGTGQGGVGCMQLTSISEKHKADDMLKPGHRDQYAGGRWHPEWNIMQGPAHLLADMQQTNYASDNDMWLAADAYNRGVQGAKDYFNANKTISPYGQEIRKKVLTQPGYLSVVKTAIQQAKEAAAAGKDGETSGATGYNEPWLQKSDKGWIVNITRAQCAHFWNNFNRATATAAESRKAIVYAALWGWYNNGSMGYNNARPMKNMQPPPSVPAEADCSMFATWCYKSAGAPDPNGLGYNGSGSTYSMWPRGQRISAAQARPGDLVFWKGPDHVAICVGEGMCISEGSDRGPLFESISVESRFHSSLQGFRTYPTS